MKDTEGNCVSKRDKKWRDPDEKYRQMRKKN